MVFHLIFLTTVLSLGLHLALSPAARQSKGRVVELCLLYLLTGMWGFGGALLSLPHIFVPDEVAAYVGWRSGGLFQVELGFASLGTSLVAILSVWIRGWFWLGPIVAKSVFLLGAASLHLRDIVENENFAPGNAGPVLFYDIAMPIIACALFVKYIRGSHFQRFGQQAP